MSSSGPSSADVLWFQGEYLFHMFGSYQVCIEGSSPTEGPKTSINFWGGLASMSSYITGMWLWRSWRFVLVYRKTYSVGIFRLALWEIWWRNVCLRQLNQELQGSWCEWSQVTLGFKKSAKECVYVFGDGVEAAISSICSPWLFIIQHALLGLELLYEYFQFVLIHQVIFLIKCMLF